MKLLCIAVLLVVVNLGSGTELGKRSRESSHRQHVYRLRSSSDSSLSIIHGKKVSIKKYPYMASFSLNGWYGSGVILNEHWILTTAFNVAWVDVSTITFRVGSSKLDKGGQLLQATKVIYHENYTGSWDYDIAVVKVKQAIKFSKITKSAKLASTEIKKGTKAVVAGWGEPNDQAYAPSQNLLRAKVTVLDRKTCGETYGSELTSRLLCTFDKKDGPCVYDYGDPLVVKGVVHGLYAGGVSCVPGNAPVLYTDVFNLHKWVEEAIKKGDNKL